jgi:predicted transcriptional regulator YdeE
MQKPDKTVEILSTIKCLRTTWSAADAESLIQQGGILIGIATNNNNEDDFRFCIGFPLEQMDLPDFVKRYPHEA